MTINCTEAFAFCSHFCRFQNMSIFKNSLIAEVIKKKVGYF